MCSIEATLEQIINKQMSQDELPVHPECVSRAHLVFSAMVARRFGGYRMSLMSSEVIVAGGFVSMSADWRSTEGPEGAKLQLRPGIKSHPLGVIREVYHSSKDCGAAVRLFYGELSFLINANGYSFEELYDQYYDMLTQEFYRNKRVPPPRFPVNL